MAKETKVQCKYCDNTAIKERNDGVCESCMSEIAMGHLEHYDWKHDLYRDFWNDDDDDESGHSNVSTSGLGSGHPGRTD